MDDFRQKIKAIIQTDGSAAPEPVKKAAMGCLSVVLLVVSVLILLISMGLFQDGSWLFGSVLFLFFLLTAVMAVTAFPLKQDSL
ncbi:hypothetical protein [Planococcus lenghuensis]|uniref:Uncharacterized protein n=1 Tax=Planococcus lenghuensis TaxID=2213202 RepID=A0A1Q2L1T7_9BACL|nr:hypothetical protein [Planococcus lenghuensis]AQQ54334.1 hypothetical protein B0X71_15330 [Planococcus lenghuensis]